MPGREIELKFDVGTDDVVPSMKRLTASDPRVVQIDATYWDTPDMQLMSWGCTLRHRHASDGSEHQWTLKIPSTTRVRGAEVRTEINSTAPPEQPPHELTALLATLVEREHLRPVARLFTTRHFTTLTTKAGRELVQLCDDYVESEVAGKPGPSFRQVEAEYIGAETADAVDAEDALGEVARAMHRAGFERSSSRSKLERVVGTHPSLLGAPRKLRTDGTIGEFISAMVGASARQLVVNDPAVRHGQDAEAIHQARVAVRRLRCNIETFHTLIDTDVYDDLNVQLKWFGGLLGEIRDADVLAQRITEKAFALGASRTIVDEVTHHLLERREFHRRQLLSAMSGDRYRRLIADLIRWANEPPFSEHFSIDKPAGKPVAKAVKRQWKNTRRQVRRLDAAAPDEQIHELRKEIKQVRYAVQAARHLGVGTKEFLTLTTTAQDQLGNMHDAVVAARWLETDVERLTVPAAFVAGQIRQAVNEDRSVAAEQWADTTLALSRLKLG